MTPEEFEAWLSGQPLVLAYIGLLLIGSLASFLILMVRIARSRKLGEFSVSPWNIRNVDFALFLVTLVLWFVLSGTAIVQVFRWLNGDDSPPGAGVMVIGGFVLQAGMLYLFMRFRFHYRNPNEGPLSPRIIPLGQSILVGLFYFLASLPVVYGVGAVWNKVLETLRDRGYDINLPLQDAVILFQETQNPFTFFGLILLAVVVAPVVEETVFRAGIFRFFKGRAPLIVALFISGVFFGLVHGNLQSLPGLIAVGMCLGLAYELSGSLRVPIFFHAFFNLNSIIWILVLPQGLPA